MLRGLRQLSNGVLICNVGSQIGVIQRMGFANARDKDEKERAPNNSSEAYKNLSKYKLSQKTQDILVKKNFQDLLPIQKAMFDPILQKKNVFGKDLTGSGKTLAYIIPVLEALRESKTIPRKATKSPLVLVTVPTRELALQTAQEFLALKHHEKEFRIASTYGGTSHLPADIMFDIVTATPGRLIQNIREEKMMLSDLQTLVIDEAHRMLDDGFLREMEYVKEEIVKQSKRQAQTIMISATFPRSYQERVNKICGGDFEKIDLTLDLKNRTPKGVDHFAINVPYAKRFDLLPTVIKKIADNVKKVIIFTNKKHEVSDLLRSGRIPNAVGLHGDMLQRERERSLNKFFIDPNCTLIATDVAARGLDIPFVDLVILLSPPNEIDLYIHRAGRTARAGKTGTVVTMWSKGDEEETLGKIQYNAGVRFKKIVVSEDGRSFEITDKLEELYSNYKGGDQESPAFFRSRSNKPRGNSNRRYADQ